MAALLPLPALAAEEPLVSVGEVHFTSLDGSTRVVAELSGVVKVRSEKLTQPDRLAIDLQNAKLSAKGATLPVADKLLKQIRMAQKDPRTVRLVLDLTGPQETRVNLDEANRRLVVEVGAAAPKTSAAPEPTARRRKAEPAPQKPAPERAAALAPEAPKRAPEDAQAKPEPLKPQPEAPKPAIPAADNPPAETRTPAESRPAARPSDTLPVTAPGGADSTPKAASPNTGAGRTLTRALGLKIGRVVIDPGHGGHDHGTTGPGGLSEKDLVLDVSLRLGALLEQRLGCDVVYTRADDTFIPLEQRTAVANQSHADLFLSIHANSSPLRGISGADVYYLNFTTSRDAIDVAARENAGQDKSIFELRELVQKIALKDKLDESRELATRLEASLSSTWQKMNSSAINRGVKKAPFVVLIGASMPSALAEIGFLSNSRDEALLNKPDQRQRLAEALSKGILQYAASLGQQIASAGQPD